MRNNWGGKVGSSFFSQRLVRRAMPRSMAVRWSEIYSSLEKPQVELHGWMVYFTENPIASWGMIEIGLPLWLIRSYFLSDEHPYYPIIYIYDSILSHYIPYIIPYYPILYPDLQSLKESHLNLSALVPVLERRAQRGSLAKMIPRIDISTRKHHASKKQIGFLYVGVESNFELDWYSNFIQFPADIIVTYAILNIALTCIFVKCDGRKHQSMTNVRRKGFRLVTYSTNQTASTSGFPMFGHFESCGEDTKNSKSFKCQISPNGAVYHDRTV